MKKSLKIFLTCLFLCPLLILTACQSPAQYSITTNPSDSSLGSIPESSEINLNKKNEGTKITLSIKENYPETNPFICWIKDYKKVVSSEKNLDLTYNAENEGNYTAVFEETSLNKMMFSSLSNISFEMETEGYSSINYTISYARTSTGSSNYSALEKGSFNIGESHNTTNEAVLYFGGAGDNYNYKIKADIELVSASETVTSFYIEYSDLINKSSFDENGTLILEEEYTGFGMLKLTFNKLNKSMFEKNSQE